MQKNQDVVIYLWIVLVSFFSSFSKELNDKAKSDSKVTLVYFISESLLHGIIGSVTGILCFSFTDDLKILLPISAVAGILGMQSLKIVVKVGLAYLGAVKNVKISDINLDDEDKKK